MSDATVASVSIRGKTFRVRSEQGSASLEEIAAYVDATMARVERATGAVDSLDVAMLAALNLAREVVESRGGAVPINDDKLRDLIDLAEAAVCGESP